MAGSEALSALAREVPAGTVLFEENDPGSRMWVIRRGRVRIFRRVAGSEIVLAFLGAGEFFGEMALLEGLPRSASAEAVEDSMLIEVDAATFEEMLRTNAEIAVRMMRKLAARVRESDKRIQGLVIESAVGRALEVLRWLHDHGVVEGEWVRVSGAASRVDLATQAGVPQGQALQVMVALERAGCVRMDGPDLVVAKREVLDEYGAFLEMKRKYDPQALLPNEAGGLKDEDRLKAMRRLLEALKLTPEDLEARQQVLSSQYRRYVELKRRFHAVEGFDS
jgi:CRP-like cAMP-binding protein